MEKRRNRSRNVNLTVLQSLLTSENKKSVAAKLDVDIGTVNRWLRTGVIDIGHLDRLCNLTGVSAELLVQNAPTIFNGPEAPNDQAEDIKIFISGALAESLAHLPFEERLRHITAILTNDEIKYRVQIMGGQTKSIELVLRMHKDDAKLLLEDYFYGELAVCGVVSVTAEEAATVKPKAMALSTPGREIGDDPQPPGGGDTIQATAPRDTSQASRETVAKGDRDATARATGLSVMMIYRWRTELAWVLRANCNGDRNKTVGWMSSRELLSPSVATAIVVFLAEQVETWDLYRMTKREELDGHRYFLTTKIALKNVELSEQFFPRFPRPVWSSIDDSDVSDVQDCSHLPPVNAVALWPTRTEGTFRVYALCVILYKLLMKRPPYSIRGIDDLMAVGGETPIVPPSGEGISPDLAVACLDGLTGRIESPAALATRLRRILETPDNV